MATAITTPFALSGEKDAIPATDAAGAVNWTSGWTGRYSISAPAPERLTVDRKAMNYVDYVMSDAIREMQKQGTANWYSAHAPYAQNARVFHAGKQWRNSINDNSAEPNTADSGWVDVSTTNVPPATAISYGTVMLGDNNDIIAGASGKVPTALGVKDLYKTPYNFVSMSASGGAAHPWNGYYRVVVETGTNITIDARRMYATMGDSATCVVMLDKREMTGAAPTLTVTASGAGSIVLKPAGSDPIELSDDANIAMLYITTMYIDGAQVVTCNLQEWEAV